MLSAHHRLQCEHRLAMMHVVNRAFCGGEAAQAYGRELADGAST